MCNKWSVYAHINKITGVVYVGITSQRLPERFRNGKGYKRNTYFSRAIEKYGWDAFKHVMLANGLSEKSAKEIERIVIASLKDDGIPLYNLTSGGEGIPGCRLSDEVIERIRKAHLGKHFTLEHRQHISESRIGRFRGENNPHYGHHHSANTRMRLSETKRGANNPNYGRAGQDTSASKRIRQYTLDGQFVSEYPSISEAARVNGFKVSGISRCCRGDFTQSYGYKWEFAKRGGRNARMQTD